MNKPEEEMRMVDPQYALAQFRSFAVVGATAQPKKYGYEIVKAFVEAGYDVYPINPKYGEILSRPCYPSLATLPQRPDVVIVALRPEAVLPVLQECADLGYGLLWLPLGCWSYEVLDRCRRLSLRFIYDRCPVGELLSAQRRAGQATA